MHGVAFLWFRGVGSYTRVRVFVLFSREKSVMGDKDKGKLADNNICSMNLMELMVLSR